MSSAQDQIKYSIEMKNIRLRDIKPNSRWICWLFCECSSNLEGCRWNVCFLANLTTCIFQRTFEKLKPSPTELCLLLQQLFVSEPDGPKQDGHELNTNASNGSGIVAYENEMKTTSM